jgi:probable F420-dependent oxidoreductase
MKFGIAMFGTDEAIPVPELAVAAEERGFASLFLPEHSHIPVARRDPWPGGADLPREYYRTLDPFVALGAAAAVTRTLELGTGITLVVQRDPIHLAKEIASLDFLSGGRVVFGIGAGWNYEEMENHGTDPRTRWSLMRERVLACKEIWTKDEASFHGQFVNFDPIFSWPKPVRVPPVLIGGDGPKTFERLLDYCDGWMPIMRPKADPAVFPARFAELQVLAAERGRGPVPVTAFGPKPDAEVLAGHAELGVEQCLLLVPPKPADAVLPILDTYADLAAKFR